MGTGRGRAFVGRLVPCFFMWYRVDMLVLHLLQPPPPPPLQGWRSPGPELPGNSESVSLQPPFVEQCLSPDCTPQGRTRGCLQCRATARGSKLNCPAKAALVLLCRVLSRACLGRILEIRIKPTKTINPAETAIGGVCGLGTAGFRLRGGVDPFTQLHSTVCPCSFVLRTVDHGCRDDR